MIDLSSLLTVDIVVAAGVVLVATGALILVAVPPRPRVRFVAGEDHAPARVARHRADQRDATTQRMAPVAALPAAPSSHPRSRDSESLGVAERKPTTVTSLERIADAHAELRADAVRAAWDLTTAELVRPYVDDHRGVSA